jgi:DNA repair exonuclease SbcCD nuclease subunit
MGIPGNEIADKEVKADLENELLSTEKYPPQDLIIWIKTEDKKTRKTRWQNSENNMKNRKKRSIFHSTRKDKKTKPGCNLLEPLTTRIRYTEGKENYDITLRNDNDYY